MPDPMRSQDPSMKSDRCSIYITILYIMASDPILSGVDRALRLFSGNSETPYLIFDAHWAGVYSTSVARRTSVRGSQGKRVLF